MITYADTFFLYNSSFIVKNRKFLFGWFPSTDIPFSIAMTELPLPSVMVIDPHSYRYFLPDDAEDPQTIVRLLDDILKNDPEPPSYGGNTFFYRIYR